jgi:glutaredoxin
MIPRVTLYTRAGCHLCETAKENLLAARRTADFELEEIDIDADPELRALYNHEVPVVAINGRKAFKYHLDTKVFLKTLRGRL